jgi:hypothetical protein
MSILTQLLLQTVHTAKTLLSASNYVVTTFLFAKALQGGEGSLHIVRSGNISSFAYSTGQFNKLQGIFKAGNIMTYIKNNGTDIIKELGSTGCIGTVELFLGTNTHFGLAVPIVNATQWDLKFVLKGIAVMDISLYIAERLLYVVEDYLNHKDITVDTDYN